MTRCPADDTTRRPFADLAQHLIALRRAARLPQRGLAEAANVSRGAVQRAESGTARPTTTVLDAYLRACGAGEDARKRARLLLVRCRTAQRGRLRELRAPAPDFINTKRELGLALALVYERAGAPSLTDARLTPGRKPLPRTTAWRIVNRKGLPADHEQLITFLTACGVRHPAAQHPYLVAYSHVIAQHGTRRLPPRAQRTQLIRRVHPVPLAHGGTDADAHFDVERLAAGIRPVVAALSADPGVRNAPAAMAAGVQAFADALTALSRSVGREAHRNGTAPPDWITTAGHGHTGGRASGGGMPGKGGRE